MDLLLQGDDARLCWWEQFDYFLARRRAAAGCQFASRKEFGGKSWVEGKYLRGSPELLLEVCNTTGAIDLHQKLELYEEARVQEYLVIVVQKKEIRWHRLVKGKYKLIPSDAQGVYCSVAFPGLWLDSKALFAEDMAKVIATLQLGIDSDEHQKFVDELAKRKRAAKK